MKLPLATAGCCSLLLVAAGCHSAYIEADLVNATSQPLSVVELDYPSASFGTSTLAPGAAFHYRFQVLGSGATKLLWTDAEGHDHALTGPRLTEGQQGSLTVTIHAATADWQPKLTGGS